MVNIYNGWLFVTRKTVTYILQALLSFGCPLYSSNSGATRRAINQHRLPNGCGGAASPHTLWKQAWFAYF